MKVKLIVRNWMGSLVANSREGIYAWGNDIEVLKEDAIKEFWRMAARTLEYDDLYFSCNLSINISDIVDIVEIELGCNEDFYNTLLKTWKQREEMAELIKEDRKGK